MKFYFYGFIILLSFSCSAPNQTESSDTKEKKSEQTGYTIADQKNKDGVTISDIRIDTFSLYHNTKGIKISFVADLTAKAFSDNTKYYFFEVKSSTTDGRIFSNRDEVTGGKGNFYFINKNGFASGTGKHLIEYQFPFRVMEMQEGEHTLETTISALPASFSDDSANTEQKELQFLGEAPMAFVKLNYKLFAPNLYKVRITVDKFKLNTNVVNPSKYDFAFGGSGYPDLFWDVTCGEAYIWNSQPQKNSVEYLKKYTSSSFTCTAKDQITIRFGDYDDGPFNKQSDIVETWTGTINDLPKTPQTLKFGNLESAVLSAEVIK